jgi:hypothetical protein
MQHYYFLTKPDLTIYLPILLCGLAEVYFHHYSTLRVELSNPVNVAIKNYVRPVSYLYDSSF